jgi:hypothetical protein
LGQLGAQQLVPVQMLVTHWLAVAVPQPLAGAQPVALVLQKKPEATSQSPLAAQLVGHDALAPLQAYGVQAGLPTVPNGAIEHVPCFPMRLQKSQLFAQVVLQQ